MRSKRAKGCRVSPVAPILTGCIRWGYVRSPMCETLCRSLSQNILEGLSAWESHQGLDFWMSEDTFASVSRDLGKLRDHIQIIAYQRLTSDHLQQTQADLQLIISVTDRFSSMVLSVSKQVRNDMERFFDCFGLSLAYFCEAELHLCKIASESTSSFLEVIGLLLSSLFKSCYTTLKGLLSLFLVLYTSVSDCARRGLTHFLSAFLSTTRVLVVLDFAAVVSFWKSLRAVCAEDTSIYDLISASEVISSLVGALSNKFNHLVKMAENDSLKDNHSTSLKETLSKDVRLLRLLLGVLLQVLNVARLHLREHDIQILTEFIGSLIEIKQVFQEPSKTSDTSNYLLYSTLTSVDPLVLELLSSPAFLCWLEKDTTPTCSRSWVHIHFLLSLCRAWIYSSQTHAPPPLSFGLLLRSTLRCLRVSSPHQLYKAEEPTAIAKGRPAEACSLYTAVLVSLSAVLVSSPAGSLPDTEQCLFESLVCGSPHESSLCADLLCVLDRFAEPSICLEHTLALAELLLSSRRLERHPKARLAALLTRLFSLLTDSQRRVLLQRYGLEDDRTSAVWASITRYPDRWAGESLLPAIAQIPIDAAIGNAPRLLQVLRRLLESTTIPIRELARLTFLVDRFESHIDRQPTHMSGSTAKSLLVVSRKFRNQLHATQYDNMLAGISRSETDTVLVSAVKLAAAVAGSDTRPTREEGSLVAATKTYLSSSQAWVALLELRSLLQPLVNPEDKRYSVQLEEILGHRWGGRIAWDCAGDPCLPSDLTARHADDLDFLFAAVFNGVVSEWPSPSSEPKRNRPEGPPGPAEVHLNAAVQAIEENVGLLGTLLPPSGGTPFSRSLRARLGSVYNKLHTIMSDLEF